MIFRFYDSSSNIGMFDSIQLDFHWNYPIIVMLLKSTGKVINPEYTMCRES